MTAALHTAVGVVTAASLIGFASVIGRRWGAGAGGSVVALPLISGPVLLTYALERGPAFAAQACLGAILATVSLSAFALVYAWAARRAGWPACCALACAAFLASAWGLEYVRAPAIAWTFLAGCIVLALALIAMPPGAPRAHRSRSRAWDIPLRMILAAVFVGVLSTLSSKVGPRVSGLLTPFPVTSMIFVAFTQSNDGASGASEYLRGLLKGLFSFAVFALVVGSVIGAWSVAATFLAATVVTLLFHIGVWHWVQRPVPVG